MSINVHALADRCESLFYERMRQQQHRGTSVRVVGHDYCETTSPRCQLERCHDGSLRLLSQDSDHIVATFAPGSWIEAYEYDASGLVIRSLRPGGFNETDLALGEKDGYDA